MIYKPFSSLLLTGVFVTNLVAQVPVKNSRTSDEWIDPVTEIPAGTHYQLFDTPSRGKNTRASYLIYLPPSYQKKVNTSYPVLYWLHGGKGSQREGAWVVDQMNKRILDGEIPEVIIVLVQGLPTVRYVDTKDGTKPVESVIIKDLIPHIDATFRTIKNSNGRAIEGMSMGGFGALRLGFRYPELFGTVSALAPSIGNFKSEPAEVQENFGFDEDFYNQNSPWQIVTSNAPKLKDKIHIRLLVGTEDELLADVTNFHLLLDSLQISHDFEIVRGAEHRYDEILSNTKEDSFLFWKIVFKDYYYTKPKQKRR
jgi:enterochelin esterase-like enzyme